MHQERGEQNTQSLSWRNLKSFACHCLGFLNPKRHSRVGIGDQGLPRPPLVVRVGVTGHLFVPKASSVETVTRDVLERIQAACVALEPEFQACFGTAPTTKMAGRP